MTRSTRWKDPSTFNKTRRCSEKSHNFAKTQQTYKNINNKLLSRLEKKINKLQEKLKATNNETESNDNELRRFTIQQDKVRKSYIRVEKVVDSVKKIVG